MSDSFRFILIHGHDENPWHNVLMESLSPHGELQVEREESAMRLAMLTGYDLVIIDSSVMWILEEFDEIKNDDALAWITLVSNIWEHTVPNQVTTIEETVDLITGELPGSVLTSAIREKFARIKRVAQKINNLPIPLLPNRRANLIAVNDLIRDQFEIDWLYNDVQLDSEMNEFPLMVRAHPKFIRHVIDLLLDNALKATRQSETKQVRISARERDGWAEILISDTGPGIPPGIRDEILKRPIPKPEGEKGTGVGLLIARRILKRYGGDIDVENTSSDGTTMLIRLPIES